MVPEFRGEQTLSIKHLRPGIAPRSADPGTVLTNCLPQQHFFILRTQTQDTLRRLGRPTAILGRRWDGLKRKKPLQSLVWDGGTAGTGGGGYGHLPIAALDTKLPSFKTTQ